MNVILTVFMASNMIPHRTVTFTPDNMHLLEDYIYNCAYHDPQVTDVLMTAVDGTAAITRGNDNAYDESYIVDTGRDVHNFSSPNL